MKNFNKLTTFNDLKVGQKASLKKTITEEYLTHFIGDTLYAWFEIIDIDPDSEEILIKSWIENQAGKNVIEGQTVASLLRGLKKS
jgi:hypothetical protein